jgi:selenium-binding protein 1
MGCEYSREVLYHIDANIFFFSAALGTSPGRLVETDADFNIIHEWPEDIEGTLGILAEQFSPHGISIDWDRNYILTSDFVVPLSILKPSTGVIRAQTLRLWNLESRTIINTITIPGVSSLPHRY